MEKRAYTDTVVHQVSDNRRLEVPTMSSRALRRLERLKDSEKSQESESSQDTDVETEREREHTGAAKANLFALLGGDESEHEDEQDQISQTSDTVEPMDTGISLKLKSSKKTKKSKKRAALEEERELERYLNEMSQKNQVVSPSCTPDQPEIGGSEETYDDIDIPVAYSDSNYLHFTTARLRESLPLLSIATSKNLDPDTELKNLFGNLSLETIEDANSTTSLAISPEVLAQFKKLARLTRGWGGKDHRSVPGTKRKLLLTRIKDDWIPTLQKPLSMKELLLNDVINIMDYKEENEELGLLEHKARNEKALGIKYFNFEKVNSVQERVANSRFYASVVMTPDPESLMQLLQQHPYHVETLLQVAMVILREGNNKATSNALVEKCLFVFDRSLDKSFHELLWEGKTGLMKLPYERFMNRQFYLCIFRIISGLGERHTFFTALNYCKLLLSLSPAEDPIGVRFFIDHYAILSEEYQYLVDFVDSPLCQTYKQWFTPGLAFSKVLALLHLNKTSEARAALKEAFLAHPYCALQMLAVIGLATKPPVKVSEVYKDDSVVVASETYLIRAGMLWKDQAHKQFVHEELMELFSFKREGVKSSWLSKWLGSKEPPSTDIPVNLVRFAILSGENRVLAKIPEKIFSRDDVLEYDVIPPVDETSNYDVFTGVEEKSQLTDSLFDYLDHNLISAIVQNRTASEFDDLITGINDIAPGDEN